MLDEVAPQRADVRGSTLKLGTHSPRLLYRLPPPRDRTKRATQGRRDARRPRGATSRRVGLSGFSTSLSPAFDERSHESLPRGPASSSTSTTIRFTTTSGSTRSLLSFAGGSFLLRLSRALTRGSSRLTTSARILGRPRAFSRACTGHAHEDTSRPRVPITCGESRGGS